MLNIVKWMLQNVFTSYEATWSCVGVGSRWNGFFLFFCLGNFILVIYMIYVVRNFDSLKLIFVVGV